MAGMLASFSGQEVIKILQKNFDFEYISQKGSHIKLRRKDGVKIITVIVSDHKELADGTLRNILRQAQVEVKNFIEYK